MFKQQRLIVRFSHPHSRLNFRIGWHEPYTFVLLSKGTLELRYKAICVGGDQVSRYTPLSRQEVLLIEVPEIPHYKTISHAGPML